VNRLEEGGQDIEYENKGEFVPDANRLFGRLFSQEELGLVPRVMLVVEALFP